MDNSIGIYIHVPFCRSKCYYCDFNSYSGRDHLAGSYFSALFTEMANRADSIRNRPVSTVFIGGGTPTLVEPHYIAGMLEVCSRHFNLKADAEISLESNPGTLTFDNLKMYRTSGVNRLSIGLQAWQDRHLESLGRIHRRQQFVDNLEAAYKAGFQNINADLIFGLPGQTLEDWVDTLEAVTSFHSGTDPDTSLVSGSGTGLAHLSCYSLKIEEGTVFGDRYHKGTLVAADDELDRSMYKYTIETLAKKGYRQYEISNFAKPGYQCRHNLIYWKAREYAGFGAGAHSYLNHTRFSNKSDIQDYIDAVGNFQTELREDVQRIDHKEAMSEFMILGLRLTDGISSEEFEARFGESLERIYGDQLRKLSKEGLIYTNTSARRYHLTALGLDLANKVFVEFI